MSDKDRNEYLEAWREFKREHPGKYTIAAVAPVTGQLAAVADYADAMERGDSVDGAIAAASLIPGFKLAKMGSKIAPPSLRLKSQMNAVEKAIAPATKNAHHIGRAADVEQSAEAFAGQYDEKLSDKDDLSFSEIQRASGKPQKARAHETREEFSREWERS